MTMPYSDAIFACTLPRECTEAFLEGHVRAFEFFGGVPRRISYDNSKIAVARITGRRGRELTAEFLRLKSHHLFKEHFCLVRRPNEKGHVETPVGFARRNFLVPVPAVHGGLEPLNARLRADCREDLARRVRGKPVTKAELLAGRRLEAEFAGPGTRQFIKVLRLPEGSSSRELTRAVERALELGLADADAIRLILEHRGEEPVGPFSLDGRPPLKRVGVPSPDLSAYASLTAGVTP
jgi:hypothetical protein